MKEIRNYKNIRRKPVILGFTPNTFYVFFGIAMITLIIPMTNFTIGNIVIWLVINFFSLILTKLVFGNESFMRKFTDEKFPTEISPLTRNKKKK